MKDLPRILRLGSGVLALCLFSPVLRAEAAEGLSKAEEKSVAKHGGKLDAGEKGKAPDDARMKADEAARAEKLKQALAKYDANHNGMLDREERAKMRDDEVLAARTERQAEQGAARYQRKLQKAQGKDVPKARKR